MFCLQLHPVGPLHSKIHTVTRIDSHLAIQDVEDSGSFQHLFGAPASINRSTAIVEDYLSFDGNNYASYDSGIGMETPLEHPMSPWMLAMKGTCRQSYVTMLFLIIHR